MSSGGDLRVENLSNKGRIVRDKLILLVLLLLLSAGCQQQSPMEKAQLGLVKAREYVKRQKVSQAIIEYRRAIQNDPKLSAAHFELGKIYLDHQDYSEASRQLNAVVKLDGSNLAARLSLASSYVAERIYDGAKQQANIVLAQHAEDPEALLILEICRQKCNPYLRPHVCQEHRPNFFSALISA